MTTTITEVIKIRDKKSLIDIIVNHYGESEYRVTVDGVNHEDIEEFTLDQLKSYIISEIITGKDDSTSESNSARITGIRDAKKKNRIEIAKAKMKRRVSAVVTETGAICSTGATPADAVGQAFEFKQFGNSEIGFQTAKVVFGAEILYPELLLDQLEEAKFIPHIQSGNNVIEGKPVKLYLVNKTGVQFQKDDIESLRKKQEVLLK